MASGGGGGCRGNAAVIEIQGLFIRVQGRKAGRAFC